MPRSKKGNLKVKREKVAKGNLKREKQPKGNLKAKREIWAKGNLARASSMKLTAAVK